MGRFLIGYCVLTAALLVGPPAGAQHFTLDLLRSGIPSEAYKAKVYGPEIMSVAELTECLLKADHLDKENAFLSENRFLPDPILFFDYYTLRGQSDFKPDSPERKAFLERRAGERYEVRLKEAVRQALYQFRSDLYGAALTAYKKACRKRYYGDDLEEAKHASGLSF